MSDVWEEVEEPKLDLVVVTNTELYFKVFVASIIGGIVSGMVLHLLGALA